MSQLGSCLVQKCALLTLLAKKMSKRQKNTKNLKKALAKFSNLPIMRLHQHGGCSDKAARQVKVKLNGKVN